MGNKKEEHLPPPVLELSIVTVNYKSADHLIECLRSIKENLKNLEYEIIVIDNASGDRSVGKIQAAFSDIVLIENKTNLGFAKANNQGIRHSRGRYILLLNNDTVVLPNAVEAMVGVLKRSADIGIVGCRLLNPDKTPQQSFGSAAGFIGDLLQSTFSNTLFANSSNPIVEKILARLHRSGKKVGWVCGACMLCRRDSLEETGLLDENFFMYKEDMDLCISFRKKNWGIYYTPDAPIIHHLGASVSAKPFETAIEYRKSQLYFYKKHYGWMGLLCLKIYLYGKFIRKLSVSFLVDCAGEPSSGNGQDSYSLNREILKVIRDFH
ncbi:MAG: glycosyltransferase family 2 protein [Nitrospinota bacterium]|nr:glycosyltransferase family 2 protein [Nitrospinota bacterium]